MVFFLEVAEQYVSILQDAVSQMKVKESLIFPSPVIKYGLLKLENNLDEFINFLHCFQGVGQNVLILDERLKLHQQRLKC